MSSLSRLLAAVLAAILLLTGSIAVSAAGPLPFTDVPESAWYYGDVLAAYESGFVDGRTATAFEPSANLTLAEVIKLAACVRQKTEEGAVTLGNAPDTWYLSYVAYALEHGMLPAGARWTDADFRRAATRGETMAVFANAASLEPVNVIPDGSIRLPPLPRGRRAGGHRSPRASDRNRHPRRDRRHRQPPRQSREPPVVHPPPRGPCARSRGSGESGKPGRARRAQTGGQAGGAGGGARGG